MSDPASSDGQPGTASTSGDAPTQIPRAAATGACLPVIIGGLLGAGLGSILHGWTWALAVIGVVVLSWLGSYVISPTPRLRRIAARSAPVAGKVGTGAIGLWAFVFFSSLYLSALIMPFDRRFQSWVVRSSLIVQVLIIVLVLVVMFHLLFPVIEPKRRAVLVWQFTQAKLETKSLIVLAFGLIVCWAIALWNTLLLLLANHKVISLYPAPPDADGAAVEAVSSPVLIHGHDIFSLLVWQLCSMVPTLNVNDSLSFEQPLFYTGSVASPLILAFKIIVGLALIGSVLAIIEAYRDKPDPPDPRSLLPEATRRVLAWRLRTRRPEQAHTPETQVQTPETANP